MSRITASSDMTQVKPEDFPKFADLFMQDVEDKINGNLDFATNFNCQLVSVTFSAANTNTPLSHKLNRVPSGYIVTGASAATSVYNGSGANSATVLNLMASAPATVGLLIY